MLALTLWPEWAWAICHLDKRVENRTWRPPSWLIGQRIGIHAGAHPGGRPGRDALSEAIEAVTYMSQDAEWEHEWLDMDDRYNLLSAQVWRGDVTDPRNVASHRLDAFITRSALVATAILVGADRDTLTAWDVPDAWHWRLADVVVLDPSIPMRGKQGLWPVAVSLEEVLR